MSSAISVRHPEAVRWRIGMEVVVSQTVREATEQVEVRGIM